VNKNEMEQIESSQRQCHETMLHNEKICNEAEMQAYRIFATLKPAHSIDGNQHCLLMGKDLQEGFAGFGDSFHDAVLDFRKDLSNSAVKANIIGGTKVSNIFKWSSITKVKLEELINEKKDKLARHYTGEQRLINQAVDDLVLDIPLLEVVIHAPHKLVEVANSTPDKQSDAIALIREAIEDIEDIEETPGNELPRENVLGNLNAAIAKIIAMQ